MGESGPEGGVRHKIESGTRLPNAPPTQDGGVHVELLALNNAHDVASLASFEKRKELGGHRVGRHVDEALRRFEYLNAFLFADFELNLHRERIVLDPLGVEQLLV